MKTSFLVAALLASVAAMPAHAGITGLFNTGVDANGDALGVLDSGDQLNDPHYIVTTSTAHPASAGLPAQTFKEYSAYAADDAHSRWVIIANDAGYVGLSTFETTFMLDGDPATAQITGFLASDNESEIWLNGFDTGVGTGNFFDLTAFTLSDHFVAGQNVLDIVLLNSGGPSGLRVAGLSGKAGPVIGGGVPEPATWALMLLGFGAVGLVARRRTGSLVAA